MASLKKTAAKTASAKLPVKTPKRLAPAVAADSKASTRHVPKATVVSSKLSFKGRIFHVYTDKVREPNGKVNTRQVIRHSGSVVILAVDSKQNPRDPDVILIRQYRHAAGQYLLELPAGRIEPGERPLAAAKREMIEETGFRARKWSQLTKYFASPGFLGEWMQIFLAEDIRPGDARPEGDEDIELVRMPLSAAMKMVGANQIHDGKTLIGLSLYAVAHGARQN
jgi:ADP-ribose pyrophosphatase